MKIKAGGGEDVASKTTINSSGILPARAATTATDCCGGPQPPSSSASSSQMSIMKWISRRTGDNIDLGLFRLGELATDHVDLSSARFFAKLSGRKLNTRTLSKKGIRKVILQAGGKIQVVPSGNLKLVLGLSFRAFGIGFLTAQPPGRSALLERWMALSSTGRSCFLPTQTLLFKSLTCSVQLKTASLLQPWCTTSLSKWL